MKRAFFASSLQVFTYIDKIPAEPSLLQAEKSQLSQLLLIGLHSWRSAGYTLASVLLKKVE